MAEIEIQFEDEGPRKLNIYRDKIWVTKTGDLIFVTDMSDSHLGNCIRMLQKKMKYWEAYMGHSDGELPRRLKMLEDEAERRKQLVPQPQVKRRIRIRP